MPRGKRSASFDALIAKKPRTSSAPFKDLIDTLHTLQDDDQSRQLVSAFVKLPSRKIYPDYYALIEQPISINGIMKKIARDAYGSAEELVADFRLMHDNAVKYNDPSSWIVTDAAKILSFVEEQAPNVVLDAVVDATPTDLPGLCLGVLDEVINYDFPDEGQLSGPFMYDVDPDEYPDYYKLIARPTSFSDVRGRIESGSLFAEENSVVEDLAAFYEATMLIFSNAQEYNDPSSLIHEDSNKLRQVFLDNYTALASELGVEAKSALKFTLKAPGGPVKLKLSLKGKTPGSPSGGAESPGSGSGLVPDAPPKKRRGRKPKKLIEEEQRLAALEAARLKQESGEAGSEREYGDGDAAQVGDVDDDLAPSESCAMGKSKTIPSPDDVFIRRVAFTSTQALAAQIHDSLASQTEQTLTSAQAAKKSAFPEAAISNAATFFDYQFAPLGYSTKAYSITLPRDSTPVVNFKVALHELIYNLKRGDLSGGQGLLKGKAEDEFMCSLYLNDEEVDNGCEMTAEEDPADPKTKLLNLTYELKLNYGLNMINFELRLSPSLSKSLKKKIEEPAESTELGGRHTRHQMQQIKLNWDVEKFTLFVVAFGP